MLILSFLSTLSLRRATGYTVNFHPETRFSIHALLAESDVEKVPADVYYQAFLSTLSLRRATENGFAGVLFLIDFSIHALLAESDWWLHCWKLAARDFSIHALLAESDDIISQPGCA